MLSRDDTCATQEEETQEISAYSSDASSIIRFPSFTFDLHTLLKLAKVSKTPAYSKASVLAAVLEIEGPDVIHIKKGLDAGKEVSLLKMILGDDEGSVCKLTAWREIAECWGAEDASGIKRGDVVFLESRAPSVQKQFLQFTTFPRSQHIQRDFPFFLGFNHPHCISKSEVTLTNMFPYHA